MSESTGKSTSKNEEIVAELNKQFETELGLNSCEAENENSSSDLPAPAEDDLVSGDQEESNMDDEETDDVVSKKDIPDDFIDEEALKELESKLSPQEIEMREKKASELKNRGNSEFKSAAYLDSIQSYTEGLRCCPLDCTKERSVLYANRAAAKLMVDRKVSAVDDCTKAIELNPIYTRAYIRRAKLYEETEKLDESLGDYKKILELDPGNREALAACSRLPPLIEERNEKMKAEMLDKLKDLGNMVLRPFGLSTDNFKLQKDPNTGGYSVNFQQAK